MPFKSRKQRAYFYHLKSVGKMDQATIDKWEAHTPKNKKLPERVEKKAMANGFWQGFNKRAADNFVTATSTNNYPGAPEKMLKWNDHGGVDPRQPEELQAAQVAGLVTLPPDIPGALCGTCMHFRPITHEMGHGFCTNPEVKMDVTDRMHCIHWTHPGVHNPAEAAAQEAQDAQFQQAMAAQQGGIPAGSYGGQVPPDVEGQTTAPQDFSGQLPPDANTQQVGQQDTALRPQTSPEAETTEGDTGQEYRPSSVGSQSGFPEGRQTSANPMVEQAVQDFQGSGAVGGGTGVDNESPAPKKKSEGKKSSGGGKGHTININVSGEKAEKTARVNFWKGIVDGY